MAELDLDALRRQHERLQTARLEVNRERHDSSGHRQAAAVGGAVDRRQDAWLQFADQLVQSWPTILAALERIPELERSRTEWEAMSGRWERRAERVKEAVRPWAEEPCWSPLLNGEVYHEDDHGEVPIESLTPCGGCPPCKFRAALADAPADPQPNGIDLIAAERRRQFAVEGWTPEHDDEHSYGALAMAAAVYAMPDWERSASAGNHTTFLSRLWPGDWEFKPTPADRAGELTKAGALIAAEIDRLLRAAREIRFMPGCTHAGVPKGTNCPLCGDLVR